MALQSNNTRTIPWRFRIAGQLTVQIRPDVAYQNKAYQSFYGPMRVTEDNEHDAVDVDCRLTDAPLAGAQHTFEQRYKGGRWRIQMDQLALPCTLHLRADRLGSVMAGQAGLGSVLRYLLGQLGFAWLHAATLVRGEQAVVLAGPSGIGKSQLVLHAIRDGWQYITDDHTLISPQGLSGLTTPVLVRGYGGWPQGLDQPPALRRKRALAEVTRRLSAGHINLMSSYTPSPDQTCCSPTPKPYPTTVCLLQRPGQSAQPNEPDVGERLCTQARRAGQFMNQWLAEQSADACTVFWDNQDRLIRDWLAPCTIKQVAIEPSLNEQHYANLAPALGLRANDHA